MLIIILYCTIYAGGQRQLTTQPSNANSFMPTTRQLVQAVSNSDKTGSGSSKTGSGSSKGGSGSSKTGSGSSKGGSGSSKGGSSAGKTGSGAGKTGAGSDKTGSGSCKGGTGSDKTGSGSSKGGSGSDKTGSGSSKGGTGSDKTGSGSSKGGSTSATPNLDQLVAAALIRPTLSILRTHLPHLLNLEYSDYRQPGLCEKEINHILAPLVVQIIELCTDRYADPVYTSPPWLTAKEAGDWEEIPGDHHCSFHAFVKCLLAEGLTKPDGKPWTASDLRVLIRELILELIQRRGQGPEEGLLPTEPRPFWIMLASELLCDTGPGTQRLIFSSIRAKDMVSERADRIEVDLKRNFDAIATAYADAIGGVNALKTMWGGELEFTLLVRHFNIKIATYVQLENGRWKLNREYLPPAESGTGRLHKLMFQHRNHYNYVT